MHVDNDDNIGVNTHYVRIDGLQLRANPNGDYDGGIHVQTSDSFSPGEFYISNNIIKEINHIAKNIGIYIIMNNQKFPMPNMMLLKMSFANSILKIQYYSKSE